MPNGKLICIELNVLEGISMATISRQFLLPKYSASKIILFGNERGKNAKMPKDFFRKPTFWIDRRIKRVS